MTDSERNIIVPLLLLGEDIEVKGFTLKNHNLRYIFKVIGIYKYYGLIGLCNMKPEDIFENDIEILRLNDFLNIFTDKEWFYDKEDKVLLAGDEKTPLGINKDNLQFILDVFKMIYCINKSNKESDIDNEMNAMLREFEEEENKVNKSKNENVTLLSFVLGVSCKHPSLNLINIWEYTVFQLMCTIPTLNKIDNENRIYSAIYNGTIETKNIDTKTIYWGKEESLISIG